MKIINASCSFASIFVISIIVSCSQTLDMSDFAWLEGQWQRVDLEERQTAYETWQVKNGKMYGIGCTLEGKDTVFVEYLSIFEKNGKHYYSADVAHNPEAVAFEITPKENGFICVNENHDFPNKISYTQNGDSLVVFISDMSEENKRYFKFVRNK